MATPLYMPVTKLSSFGTGKNDYDNARYISRRAYVVMDESGNVIDKRNGGIAAAVRERHASVPNPRRSSFRVIVSLPVEGAADALAEVQAELADRYSSFICAYHDTNDMGVFQPHIHALIFRDAPGRQHPLADRGEIYKLKGRLAERFRAMGIKFEPKSAAIELEENLTQAETHIVTDGRQAWKGQMRTIILDAFKRTIARCHDGN